MASQQLKEIRKKLDVVTKKQDKYEQLFFKNEQDTAGTSFTDKTTRSDQQEKLVKLSTLIDSIKDEIGRLATAIEKQEQDLDDLEQCGRSNCLLLHGNNLDHRISNRKTEKYVISTLNSCLDLPFTISEKDIDICHPYLLNLQKKTIIIKFIHRSVRNSVYAGKKNLKKSEGPKLSITDSLTKRRLIIHILEEARKSV